MAIRLLIFDLDGTLIDSAQDITMALNHAMGPDVEPVTTEQTKAMIGEGAMKLLAKLLEQRRVTTDRPVLMKNFLDYYSSHLDIYTEPYPEVKETLEKLGSYKKAVVSNKLHKLSVKTLEAFGLLRHFDFVAGGDTSPERKPSPRAILPVLDRFEVKPEETILIGDSIYDVEAGRAAGVKTVAVTYGYGGAGFARNADYQIDVMGKLVGIVRDLDNGRPESRKP